MALFHVPRRIDYPSFFPLTSPAQQATTTAVLSGMYFLPDWDALNFNLIFEVSGCQTELTLRCIQHL